MRLTTVRRHRRPQLPVIAAADAGAVAAMAATANNAVKNH